MEHSSARLIEEVSLNSWPSLQQILFDGWVLRFANGYTRRANSTNPIYPGALDVTQKIKRCEQIYTARKLPPVFKITPFVHPPKLDEQLATIGYQKEAPTSVQALDLADLPQPPPVTVQQWSEPVETWVAQYARMNQVAPENLATLRAILHHIAPQTSFVTLMHQHQAAACGLGVLDGPYLGLFDIVTAPAQRGQGLGTKLLLSVLSWGKQQGAATAYLQVMLNNKAALKLYAKLGFQEIYQYWYRVQG